MGLLLRKTMGSLAIIKDSVKLRPVDTITLVHLTRSIEQSLTSFRRTKTPCT